MPSPIEIEDIIDVLYSIILERTPADHEIESHTRSFAAGAPLDEIVKTISTSDEANQRLMNRAIAHIGLGDVQNTHLKWPVEISVDDLMNVLALSYEIFLGRQPAFGEVAQRFKAVVNGSSLNQEISSIFRSDEAENYQRKNKTFDSRPIFSEYISEVYRACLSRVISEGEIDIWYGHYMGGLSYRDVFVQIANSNEAVAKRAGGALMEWSPGLFTQLAFEIVLGRGAAPATLADHARAIEAGETSRQDVLNGFFVHAARLANAPEKQAATNNPAEAYVFGNPEPLTAEKWRAREQVLDFEPPVGVPTYSRFPFISNKTPLVSVLTSLFKGGRFIEYFLDNITSQTIFQEYCELIIIDANSPEGEYEKAKKFMSKFTNIKYFRYPYQIGIYDAWNAAIGESRGVYCTNANLDDCRRSDSLELQSSTLEALPFVDIVYQDVLYSFQENMRFDDIQRFGFQTKLPIISRYNLLEFNSPHNAPMWRKCLHDEVGPFNGAFRSAGDVEFWVRCLLADKVFYKINDPHVAYYNNPEGLSTRIDTLGAVESDRVTKTFNRRLISPDLAMPSDAFTKKLAALAGGEVVASSRYAMVQAALRKISAEARLSTRMVR